MEAFLDTLRIAFDRACRIRGRDVPELDMYEDAGRPVVRVTFGERFVAYAVHRRDRDTVDSIVQNSLVWSK
ncbi:MAG TPA: hypothetical protein VKD22_10310 [Ramlibacter sp.]|nr:hypothetical protein [Ramlibacter sp.]